MTIHSPALTLTVERRRFLERLQYSTSDWLNMVFTWGLIAVTASIQTGWV